MSMAFTTQHKLLTILFCIIAFMTTGCDKLQDNSDDENQSNKIVKLDKNNINRYARQIAENYLTKHKALLEGYYKAKKANDVNQFIEFRNYEWSQDYVALKQTYTAVFKLNKDFLENEPSAPLFALYENLMYIGLDLKNGFLEGDETRQQNALAAAQNERQMVIQIAQQLPKEKQKSTQIISN